MPLRSKYSITQWVLNRHSLNVGDIVAIYDSYRNEEIHYEVMSFPIKHRNQITCREINNTRIFRDIDLYDINTFLISKCPDDSECSCGAKHTSNPKHHLSYCDIYKKNRE